VVVVSFTPPATTLEELKTQLQQMEVSGSRAFSLLEVITDRNHTKQPGVFNFPENFFFLFT